MPEPEKSTKTPEPAEPKSAKAPSPVAVTPPQATANQKKPEIKSRSKSSTKPKSGPQPRSRRSVRKTQPEEGPKRKPTNKSVGSTEKRSFDPTAEIQILTTDLKSATSSQTPALLVVDREAAMKTLTSAVRPSTDLGPVETETETPTVFEKINAVARPAVSPMEKHQFTSADKTAVEEKSKKQLKPGVAVVCKDDTPTAYGGPPRDLPPDDAKDKMVTSAYIPLFPAYQPPS